MKLGRQVLSKIENLITQIDQKPQKKVVKHTVHFTQSNDDTFKKLYDENNQRQQRRRQKQRQKQLQQHRICSPFKITNPHTIFLNSQNKAPPLHMRLELIQKQKKQEIKKLKAMYPTKQELQLAEDEKIIKQMQQKRKKQHRYSRSQLNDLVQDMKAREKSRQQKNNARKLRAMQDTLIQFNGKPFVSKQSKVYFKKHCFQRQLSTSVFQRFQQYQMERRTRHEEQEKKFMNQNMPFTPKISQKSRLMASKSTSRTNLHKSMGKSSSCKCFARTKRGTLKQIPLQSSRLIV